MRLTQKRLKKINSKPYMKRKHIFFITGASGVGKTTLISRLKEKFFQKNHWSFLHFDSIGVPSTEEMIAKYGSPSEWQKSMTYEWIEKMLNEYNKSDVIIFEGQVNLDFIKKGFAQHDFLNYTIILLHCDQKKMIDRLKNKRKQPEIVNDDMKNWLKFLHKQAKDFKASIIDTSKIDENKVVKKFEKIILNNGVSLRRSCPKGTPARERIKYPKY